MALLVLLAGGVAAQRQRKQSTLRALGVVEWPAKGRPRLVPVCILVDGRYYDAGIYLADPVPMALDGGNVYEVEKTGAPQGFFTLSQAQQVGSDWYGLGGYRSLQQVQVAEKGKSEVTVAGGTAAPNDEPPRLTRGNEATKPPTQPAGDNPPVLKKPSESGGAQPAASSQQGPASGASQSSSDEEDPNRPVLRRGKPKEQMAEETIEPPKSAVLASSAPGSSMAGIENPAALTKVLPAISDAKGPDPRDYAFGWTPQEQAKFTAGMQELARASLQQYASPRGEAAGPLQDVQVQAFDLDLTNEAVFVLTAAAPSARPPVRRTSSRGRGTEAAASTPPREVTYFVTVVARSDLDGNLRRIFQRVTDSGRLDAYARLELIDAVDVDGDGRGELLFRSINDQSRAFVIYRAGVDNLTPLFNSRELEQ